MTSGETKDYLEKRANEIIRKCNDFILTSISGEGYPRPCIVGIMKAENFRTIYASTGSFGTKVKHFKANPKAGAAYFLGGDSVSLMGNVEIVEDRAEKESVWQEWMFKHFPKGIDDENYCLLKFTGIEATIYIDEIFETYKYCF